MQALTGHALHWVQGKASGYARFCFSDQIYPGMVAREGAITPGRVYTAVTRQTGKILDQFEDPVYQRKLIDVDRSDASACLGGACCSAAPAFQRGLAIACVC